MWRIEFSSAEFLPYLPEGAQANPGVYGFELALWLSRALAGRGLVTGYPLSEDWGWLIEFIDGDDEITVGCGSMCEEGDGYSGNAISWSIFVRPQKPLKSFFSRSKEAAVPVRLTQAIEAALADKGIEVKYVEV